jgi:integrase
MIKLRIKSLSDGKKSFYLDIYFKGTRSYEFLNLYVEPNTSRTDAKRITAIAEQIRTRREETLLAGYHGVTPNFTNDLKLTDYFESIEREKNMKMYTNTLKHIRKFQQTPLPLTSVNSAWVSSFKDYLERQNLGINSIATYLNALKAVLNRAVRENLIIKNPFNIPIKTQFREKVFLNEDEVMKISKVKKLTEKQEQSRLAFLFACFSGLRISDLKKLKWSNLDIKRRKISLIQVKTSDYVYLPLAKTCVGILKQLKKTSEYVFPFISSVQTQTYDFHLRAIIKKARIDKNVTSHTARHTFATMALTKGVDIYTVSKILGHSDIKVTQVYAKIIDSKKDEAINKLPDLWK